MTLDQRCWRLLLTVLAVLFSSAQPSKAARYAARDYGPGTPVALNNRGEILAMISPEEGVLIHSPTNRTTIFRRQGALSGVNDRGEVVGWVMHDYRDEFFPRPLQFFWREGVMQPLNGERPEDGSRGVALNNASVVAGQISVEGGSPPARWRDGAWENILLNTAEPWWLHGETLAINQLGVIVGAIAREEGLAEGFVWSEAGGLVRLGYFGGATSRATDINDEGTVVGLARESGSYFAWEWKKGSGRVLNISHATAPRVNKDGVIVSSRFIIKGDSVTNINELVSDPPWLDATLIDINDRGELLVNAYSNGAARLFLLQPAPHIVEQPASQSAEPGETVRFTVRAEGAQGFQWYHNDTLLPGQSEPTLTLTNIQSAHQGFYHAAVTNHLGAVVLSEKASLTVTTPPLLRISAVPRPELILTGIAGPEYRIEARNDLVQGEWEAVLLVRLTNNVTRVPLLDGLGLPSRFFRAIPR